MLLDPAVPSFRKATNQWLARIEISREPRSITGDAHRSRAVVKELPFGLQGAAGISANHLLRALRSDVLATVSPFLERVRVEQRDLLLSPREKIEFVYFPETMVGSLVSILAGGEVAEVGTIGCEGIIGLPLFLGESTSSHQAFTQVPGFAQRVSAAAFMRVVHSSPEFQLLLLRYTQAFLTQVMQTAVCNATHLVEQRCARWILTTSDRVIGEELELTHDFLAFTLGVRREGVTVAMSSLVGAGLISCHRGRVQVCDRTGLEAVACECYALLHSSSWFRHEAGVA